MKDKMINEDLIDLMTTDKREETATGDTSVDSFPQMTLNKRINQIATATSAPNFLFLARKK